MKLATGSNAPHFAYKVSIQQPLDGHSFSFSGLNREFPGEEAVGVEILTPQTLLTPAPLFEPEAAAELLAAAGMGCTQGQCAVWSAPTWLRPETEAVAVMAIEEETLRTIRERLGYRAAFTTPLFEGPTSEKATVWLRRTAGLLYIKVFGRTLRMAEAIPATTEADILYFIERLAAAFPLDEMQLRLTGTKTEALRKLIGKRFRKVLCES